MKNHECRNRKLIQTNKKFSQLQQYPKERICIQAMLSLVNAVAAMFTGLLGINKKIIGYEMVLVQKLQHNCN
jgi:hypothetical protein